MPLARTTLQVQWQMIPRRGSKHGSRQGMVKRQRRNFLIVQPRRHGRNRQASAYCRPELQLPAARRKCCYVHYLALVPFKR